MEEHEDIPVFWSNHSFQVWEMAHEAKNELTSLRDENIFASKNYSRQKKHKFIIDKLETGEIQPSDAIGYSNGWRHIMLITGKLQNDLKNSIW